MMADRKKQVRFCRECGGTGGFDPKAVAAKRAGQSAAGLAGRLGAQLDRSLLGQAWDECAPNFVECPAGSPCSGFSGRERERCIDLGYCRGHAARTDTVFGAKIKTEPMPEGAMLGFRTDKGITYFDANCEKMDVSEQPTVPDGHGPVSRSVITQYCTTLCVHWSQDEPTETLLEKVIGAALEQSPPRED